MLRFLLLLLVASASSHAQLISADDQGNLVASVKDGKQVLIKEGDASVAIVDEVKQARRATVDNAASIATEARTARAEASNNAECSGVIADVVDKVATLVDTIKPADASSSEAILKEIVEQLAVNNAILNASSNNAAVAAAANTGPSPITYSSIIHTSECGKTSETACDAIYHARDDGADDELFSLLVRTNGGGYYDAEGIYECEYTVATTGDVVTTPAVLVPERGSMAAGRVGCIPPVQDPEKTTKSTWSASVGLLEGGFTVPRVNAAGEAVESAATLLFSSHGPSVVGIPATVSVMKGDLTKSVATLSFSVEDRDSAAENITVTATAKNEDFVTGVKVALADNIYTLAVTVDEDYDGDTITEITVSAKDEHDQTTDFTFKFELGGYVAFWARMSAMTTVESSTQLPFWIGDTTKGNKGWTIAKDGEDDDNTFQIGDAFDVKTGAFTATTDGYYMVASQVRVDGCGHSEYMQLLVMIAGDGWHRRAMTATLGKSSAKTYETLRASGTLYLEKGQSIYLQLDRNSGGSNVNIEAESGWGVAKVPDSKGEGLVGKQQGCMWHPQKTEGGFGNAGRWRYFDRGGVTKFSDKHHHAGGFVINDVGFDHAHSTLYTAQEAGVYKIDIVVRFDNVDAGSQLRLHVYIDTVNDGGKLSTTRESDGSHLIESYASGNYHTMNTATHMYLQKGDKVGIGYYNSVDSGWRIQSDTSFSAIRLGPKDQVGFQAITNPHQDSNPGGWVEGGFYSTPEVNDVSNFDKSWAFDSGHFDGKVFTAPVDGIYSVTAQQRYDGAGGDYWRLQMVKNWSDKKHDEAMMIGYSSGIHTIRGEAPGNYFSLGVNGFMRLKKGETLSLWAFGTHTFTMQSESGFSAALVSPL